jgi:hypothetical protein
MPTHSSQTNLENKHFKDDQTPNNIPAQAKFDWKMLAVVTLIIVFIREVSVWLMTQIGYENLGNFLGLFLLFGFAVAYRISQGEIPPRLGKLKNTQRRNFCISTDLCGHRHLAGGIGQ